MKTRKMFFLIAIAVLSGTFLSGCVSMKLKVPDYTDPLKEFTIEGHGKDKVLVIPISGFISTREEDGMMRRKPSMVKEVVSQIEKAETDPHIRAIVLKVNSHGGSATGSDILYNELADLKTRKGIPIVVSMMEFATSGGYYISLPADHIIAHPTTITGSVGVVFMRPKLTGMMEKIGVTIETSKSGVNKDMGSPFRPSTDNETESFQAIIDEMAAMFKAKVEKHRKLKVENMKAVMTAKIFTAQQALELGLIDQIGFTDDALNKARSLAGIEGTSRVVMYRRIEFADDNIYNTITARAGSSRPLLDLGPVSQLSDIKAGFYYAWPAAIH